MRSKIFAYTPENMAKSARSTDNAELKEQPSTTGNEGG
jgi:hypothetical protein